MRRRVAVVVPVRDEADNVARLTGELQAALDPAPFDYVVLFVDDGSSDATFARLEEICRGRPEQFGCLRLRRNFGQAVALAVGFQHPAVRDSEIVVTLDGDGQNPPAEIPKLVARLGAGYDLVCGWRRRRQDPFLTRRLPSLVANRLIRWTTRVPIHDFGCGLRACQTSLLDGLDLRSELHRLLPALLAETTSRIVEVPVEHRPRTAGRSKYGLGRTLRVLLDLVAIKFLQTYAQRPMYGFGLIGLLLSLAGAALWIYLLIDKFAFGIGIGDRPLLILGAVFILAGIQLVGLGLLGELLARQHEPLAQRRRVVAEIGQLGFDERGEGGRQGGADHGDGRRTSGATTTNPPEQS